VGELCHFVDLCTYLVGQPPVSVFAQALGRDPEIDDSSVVLLRFPDGSAASIQYLASAADALPKERFEVSGGGRTARCDNFRTTEILSGGRTRRHRTTNQDKGQQTAVSEVVAALREGRPSPFGLDELAAVSRATFAVAESAASGAAVVLKLEK
jgi:predicted dehydrogenase